MTEVNTRTIGMDIGDKYTNICVLQADGTIDEETRIASTKMGVTRYFAREEPTRVAMEVGTHSPWMSALIGRLGHQFIVANPRMLAAIYLSDKKDDRSDAWKVAELARVSPTLLHPIQHRGEDAQNALALIRARDVLVRARVELTSHARGTVKTTGNRLPSSSTGHFHKLAEFLPEERREALEPLMRIIEVMTAEIRGYDKKIEELAETAFPETAVLREVPGVGTLTSLAFVTTLEDHKRFATSRQVGSYLGLRPRLDKGGTIDKQLPISKSGDPYVRRLMVGSAQHILGPFGPETDLRLWGLKIAARGGKNAKKRAVVAVARKLSVLLHTLWKTQSKYEPLRSAASISQPPVGDGALSPNSSTTTVGS